VKDLEMRDGVIDVDVATPANRGFFGIQFRLANEGANGEWVYLRQHKSGLPDAMQYTPVLNTGANWQIYNGPGFTGAIDIPKDAWFHMRLEVVGAQAKLYVKEMDKPALVMNDLKSGVQKGLVALHVLTGATYFSNFEVRETPAAPWERHQPPMPPDTLTKWSLSPSYDALARNLERPLLPQERDAIQWQDVEAEPPGFVVIYRYREAPHLRVTFANDFSKRLEPQPGMKVVYGSMGKSLHPGKAAFNGVLSARLAALLHRLPRDVLRNLQVAPKSPRLCLRALPQQPHRLAHTNDELTQRSTGSHDDTPSHGWARWSCPGGFGRVRVRER
jgi:hypothetical protein